MRSARVMGEYGWVKMEIIKGGKSMTGQIIQYDRETQQVFVIRENKVRLQQYLSLEDWERMKKKARLDGALVKEEPIKVENITNPNYSSITLWKLRHPNGTETIFRGSWQALFKKYNGKIEEV